VHESQVVPLLTAENEVYSQTLVSGAGYASFDLPPLINDSYTGYDVSITITDLSGTGLAWVHLSSRSDTNNNTTSA